MNTINLVFAFFIATTGFYGLTLAVVLLVRKNYLPKANRTLAAILFCFAIFLFDQAIRLANLYDMSQIGLLVGTFWFLVAPLVYFHARFTTHPRLKVKPLWLLHAMPALLHLINVLPLFVYLSYGEQEAWVSGARERGDLLYHLMTSGLVLLAQLAVYIGLTQWHLNRFLKENKAKLSVSGINRVHYTRNSYLVFGSIALVMESLALGKVPGNWFVFVLMSFVVVIFSLAYLSMARPNSLFTQIPFRWTFRSRALPPDELSIYEKMLTEQIENRIYRDPELTLDKLAQILKLQPRQLSGLIRQSYDSSFPAFLNGHRIEEAKILLADPAHRHWSILAIGLEVGFNSKSTFNRVFKKMEGCTPSEFLRANDPSSPIPQ